MLTDVWSARNIWGVMSNGLRKRDRTRLLRTVNGWLEFTAESADISFLFEKEVSQVLDVLDKYVDFLSADLELAHAVGCVYWLRYSLGFLADGKEGNKEEDLSSALAWFELVAEVNPDSVPKLAADLLQDSGDILEQALASDDAAELDRAIEAMRKMVGRLPADYHHRPGAQTNLAVALQVRFERCGELSDIDEAIELNKQAVTTVSDDDADLVMYLTNLGAAFSTRFDRTEDLADLDEAIRFLERAADVSPPGHSELATCLNNLGAAYLTRFKRNRVPQDLDAAVEHAERAVVLSLDHDGQRHAERLRNLVLARQARHDLTGSREDLAEAIRAGELAVMAFPAHHPEVGTYLSHLSDSLLIRFEREGAIADADRAIELLEAAIAAAPDGQQASRLADLGEAFRARYQRTRRLADLDAAVRSCEEGLAVAIPGTQVVPRILSNLGITLQARSELTGSLEDLDVAVSAGQRAVSEGDGHPGYGLMLANLCAALQMRFEWKGTQSDLDEAVRIGERAVAATPGDAAPLLNLSLTLRFRFNHTGRLQDLETAIELSRRAVAVLQDGATGKGTALTGLAAALRVRFEHTRELADIDAAIQACQHAIAATHAGTAEQAEPFAALAAASQARFARTNASTDLDMAVAAGKAALAALPASHTYQGRYLANLAMASLLRFGLSGETADLDTAVDAAERAAALTDDGHSGKARALSNLAIALKKRFDHTGQLTDLDAAVRAIEQASSATPHGHPDQAGMMLVLSDLLRARYEHSGDRIDLDAAADAGRRGASAVNSPARSRMHAARAWAHACAVAGRWPEAAEGYSAAVGLLSRVSPRWMKRPDQEGVLAEFPRIGTSAAACCIEAGMAERAVQVSEQGRGVLLGYALDTRTDLTDLTRAHPALAEQFAGLRDALDAPAAAAAEPRTGADAPTGNFASAQSSGGHRQALTAAFEALVQQIRAVQGFESFLEPPSFGQLRQAAADGPVVLVNVAHERSDALIVTVDRKLELVPLPGLTPESLNDQAMTFFGAVNKWPEQDAPPGESTHEESLLKVLRWLWDMVTGPVLDRLGITGPPPIGLDGQPAWSRLWWCPSGLLSFLPLHASGHHDHLGGKAAETVLDRVVSSYTPTLRALAYARQSKPPATRTGFPAESPSESPDQPGLPGAGQLVAVAMDTTSGLGPQYDLPGVTAEIDMLNDLFPGSLTLFSGSTARRQDVLKALPGARWAHFACHAQARLQAPSASSLLLSDWDSDPLTVVDIARLHLDHAELAFLSACSTGRGGLTLPDEAIHLGSAFELAGFRHVIATLWQVEDRHAAAIARDTYLKLQADGDTNRAALALHAAIRAQRRRAPGTPSSWASHVHVGV